MVLEGRNINAIAVGNKTEQNKTEQDRTEHVAGEDETHKRRVTNWETCEEHRRGGGAAGSAGGAGAKQKTFVKTYWVRN